MVYLRKRIADFITSTNKQNFFLAPWSMPTIWGGASLLKMHLKALDDLYQFKESGKWNWDFIINLSESDFPVKYTYFLFFN